MSLDFFLWVNKQIFDHSYFPVQMDAVAVTSTMQSIL